MAKSLKRTKKKQKAAKHKWQRPCLMQSQQNLKSHSLKEEEHLNLIYVIMLGIGNEIVPLGATVFRTHAVEILYA